MRMYSIRRKVVKKVYDKQYQYVAKEAYVIVEEYSSFIAYRQYMKRGEEYIQCIYIGVVSIYLLKK